MTDKADFTDEEWTRLKRAPFVAGMAISLSDPGGPIELVKDTSATLKTVAAAAEDGGRGAFVTAVATEVAAESKARQNPLRDFKPAKGALAGQEILEELTAVNAIVSAKASPEDADAYRTWLKDAALEAANAAKEGASWGFTPSASAKASSGCWTSSARPSRRRPERRGVAASGWLVGRKSKLGMGKEILATPRTCQLERSIVIDQRGDEATTRMTHTDCLECDFSQPVGRRS